jgi:hypothetical protein
MAVSSAESNAMADAPTSRLVTRLALRFGVGAGLVCGLWMLGLQLTGNNGFGPKQVLAQLLVPLAALTSEWVLRKKLQPEKPGLRRSLGVGLLTVLIAAVISASSVLALAYGVGEPALARNRAEVKEIVMAQQRENPKVMRSEQEIRQQLQNVDNLTAKDLATSNFAVVLLFGLVLALPGGIFFRE